MREPLLALQFSARRRDRAARHPDGAEQIVELDGCPVGAVTVDPSGGGDLIVDLAVLPAARGRGVGTAVMESVIAGGRDVVLSVERRNTDARRLYARLGFEEVEADAVRVTLRRAARPSMD